MKWKKLNSESVLKSPLFEFRIDQCELPSGRVMPRYYVLDFPDWVQICAITKEQEILLLDQYRYPGGGQFFEFPGGSTEPSTGESALVAAQRELREETGFISDDWKSIGSYYANPALQTNQVQVFLARNCVEEGSMHLDPFEDIKLKRLPLKDLEELMLGQNKGAHGLMLATYALFQPYLK